MGSVDIVRGNQKRSLAFEREIPDKLMHAQRKQKRDLVLAHVMCPNDLAVKGKVRTVSCLSKTRNLLRGTF